MPDSTNSTYKERLRDAFLSALKNTGSVLASCEISTLARSTAYDWRDSDKDFARAWDKALDRSVEALEDEAISRRKEGVDRPVFQGGVKVGVIREYSDQLLIFILRWRQMRSGCKVCRVQGIEPSPTKQVDLGYDEHY